MATGVLVQIPLVTAACNDNAPVAVTPLTSGRLPL